MRLSRNVPCFLLPSIPHCLVRSAFLFYRHPLILGVFFFKKESRVWPSSIEYLQNMKCRFSIPYFIQTSPSVTLINHEFLCIQFLYILRQILFNRISAKYESEFFGPYFTQKNRLWVAMYPISVDSISGYSKANKQTKCPPVTFINNWSRPCILCLL